jgi:predicted ATPase
MISYISIRNFKGIKELERLHLSDFHVLVGPNGAGKTTFLEAIDFVADCLKHGPVAAVEKRGVADFDDLTWHRQGGVVGFELWLDLAEYLPEQKGMILHYQLSVCKDDNRGVRVENELLSALSENADYSGPKILLGCKDNGTYFYMRYQEEDGLSYQDSFNFGSDRLALALTPPDDEKYPLANAVRRFLMQGVRYIQLDSQKMRIPCSVTRGTNLDLDGSNMARVVGKLMGGNGGCGPKWAVENSPVWLWAEHLRYALPELIAIGWNKRQADNAEFILLRYENGLELPGWLLSDGTLRMLALTLPAFLRAEPAVYMVEEPENGVHPKALEIILRSLSSIPDGQMLIATHSPFVVQQCGIEPLLCFSGSKNGVVILPGKEHPVLQEWDGTPDLGLVFAAGVLE